MTDHPSTGREVLDRALQALTTVTRAIRGQDLNLPTPCQEWNVAQLVQHAAGDQIAWAAAVGGGPGPAENPFTPSGHLDVTPLAVVERACAAAVTAWGSAPPGDTEVPTPLPQGPMPASLAAGACALDAGVHAWDLAMATGQQSPLTAALADELRAAAREIVEPLRGFAYAPALPPEPGDDAVATLLRYLGRKPDWKAAN